MSINADNQYKKPSFLGKIGRAINRFRLVVVNLIFILAIVLVIVAVKQPTFSAPEKGSLLLFNPSGRIVLRYSQSPLQQALEALENQGPSEVLLQDLLITLKEAAGDEDIEALLLNLDGLWPSGVAMMEELDKGLEDFIDSGKTVYAYASYLSREAFPLYARVENLTVDPFVFVQGLGYSTSRLFMAKGLDQWGIKAHIYKAGDYKSFTDVYTDEKLSPSARNEMMRWLGGLWDEYRNKMQTRLSWEDDNFDQWVEGIHKELDLYQGNWGELLLARGWIKDTMDWDQFDKRMDKMYDSRIINYMNYSGHILSRMKMPSTQVALLPLAGDIQYGEGNWKHIGSESVIRTLESIQDNPDIQALVLWVDSPGGSAIASEEIRRTLMNMKKHGLPIVMVMNNTAASGAYWLASAADYIFVSPSTITGSIGVFSLSFSAEEFLQKELGMTEDGYSTTAWSRRGSLIAEPSSEAAQMNQAEVQFIYNEFLQRVSSARGLELEELDSLAGGRIWIGREAVSNGLADEIGSLDEALVWISEEIDAEPEETGYVLYMEDMNNQLNSSGFTAKVMEVLVENRPGLMEKILQESMEEARAFNDPRGIAAYWEW